MKRFYFITISVPEIVCIICVTVLKLVLQWGPFISLRRISDPKKTLRTTNLAYQKYSVFQRCTILQSSFKHFPLIVTDGILTAKLVFRDLLQPSQKLQYPQECPATVTRSPKPFTHKCQKKMQKKAPRVTDLRAFTWVNTLACFRVNLPRTVNSLHTQQTF